MDNKRFYNPPVAAKIVLLMLILAAGVLAERKSGIIVSKQKQRDMGFHSLRHKVATPVVVHK
ncbi:MAG: hypothetical protein V4543_13805 [Bacteroidota bacterium]